MRQKRTSAILFALAIGLAAAATAYPQQAILSQPPGTVQGALSWADGSGPAGVPIIIEGEGTGIKRELVTGRMGTFTTSLPPGVYKIYLSNVHGDPAYHYFRRAKFRLLPGATEVININPYAGFDYCSGKSERIVNLRSNGPEEPDVRNLPAPQYQVYENHPKLGEQLDLVVEHCKRDQRKDYVLYKSVVITYDELTIYADEAIIRNNDLQIITRGKEATYVLRGVTKTVKKLKVSFVKGKPYIEQAGDFPTLVKGQGAVGKQIVFFKLNFERRGFLNFEYEDQRKKIKLSSKQDELYFLTAEAPNRIKLSGVGVLFDTSLPIPKKRDGYYSYTVTVQADGKRGAVPGSLSIDILGLGSYHFNGSIPKGSVEILHGDDPAAVSLAEARDR